MNKKHLGLISLLCATLLLGGCGTKSDIKKYVVGELSTFSSAGCEAVNLNTLIFPSPNEEILISLAKVNLFKKGR